MEITLHQVAKKYNREYIFRGMDYRFESGNSYAITGANGSGKSTLIQVLSGYVRPSHGEILYNQGLISVEEVFNNISLSTPYMEVIEEFSLIELLDFHFTFKNPIIPKSEIIKTAYLQNATHKPVKNFSSGMKQRLKLAIALFSDTPLLLLDEPTSNLDAQGISWYREQMSDALKNTAKTVVIASNQSHEYDFCTHRLHIEDFKNPVT